MPDNEIPAHLPPDVAHVWGEFVGRSKNVGAEFEAWCGQVARLRDAQHRLSVEGLVVADAKGSPIPHPALVIERQAQAELRAWGARFSGLGKRASGAINDEA